MHKKKIKFTTPEDIANFVSMCSRYECDINIYDGSTIIDAKSIIGVFSIQQGKVIDVKAITSDENVIIKFLNDIRKYEV